MSKRKKLLYISHPYGGKEENREEVNSIVYELYRHPEIFNNFVIMSPIACFGYMYDRVDYQTGIDFCTDLLLKCDAMIMVGDWENSTGCKIEKELADEIKLPYIIIKDYVQLLRDLEEDLPDKIAEL